MIREPSPRPAKTVRVARGAFVLQARDIHRKKRRSVLPLVALTPACRERR